MVDSTNEFHVCLLEMIHSTIARVRNQRNQRQNNNCERGDDDNSPDGNNPQGESAEFDTEGTIKKFDMNANANPPVAVVNSGVMEKSGKEVDSEFVQRSVLLYLLMKICH